jgi:hypothetical protein
MKRRWFISTRELESGEQVQLTDSSVGQRYDRKTRIRLITCVYQYRLEDELIEDEVSIGRIGGPGGITLEDRADIDEEIIKQITEELGEPEVITEELEEREASNEETDEATKETTTKGATS